VEYQNAENSGYSIDLSIHELRILCKVIMKVCQSISTGGFQSRMRYTRDQVQNLVNRLESRSNDSQLNQHTTIDLTKDDF
jgi:hypothetical protein